MKHSDYTCSTSQFYKHVCSARFVRKFLNIMKWMKLNTCISLSWSRNRSFGDRITKWLSLHSHMFTIFLKATYIVIQTFLRGYGANANFETPKAFIRRYSYRDSVTLKINCSLACISQFQYRRIFISCRSSGGSRLKFYRVLFSIFISSVNWCKTVGKKCCAEKYCRYNFSLKFSQNGGTVMWHRMRIYWAILLYRLSFN